MGSHDKRTGSRVQGVRLRDIGEDFIWIQRLETPRDVEPEIIRELRKFAFNKQPNDFVFDLNASTVRKFTKNYAKNARIKDWPYVHPDSLRFLLAPKVSQFRRELRKLFIDDIPVAEKMSDYYIANYCLENNLRRLIRETLSEHGENWWLEKVPQEIKNYVLDRQRAERDTPMSIRSNEPLDYATFGHLKVILDANWRDFQDKIRSQKAIGEILNELNELRAVIAHSCDLNDREKTRLQLRVKDWLDQDLRKHT